MLTRAILKRTTKTKKILRGERFFSPCLKGISSSLAEILGEINRNVIKASERSNNIANAFGVE